MIASGPPKRSMAAARMVAGMVAGRPAGRRLRSTVVRDAMGSSRLCLFEGGGDAGRGVSGKGEGEREGTGEG